MSSWERRHRFDGLRQRERDRRRLRALNHTRRDVPREAWPSGPVADWAIWTPAQNAYRWGESPDGPWHYPLYIGTTGTPSTYIQTPDTWSTAGNYTGNNIIYQWRFDQEWVDEDRLRVHVNASAATPRETWWRETTRPPNPEAIARHREETERRATELRVIENRANELLNSVLTDEQRAVWERERYIPVRGGVTGLMYHVRYGRQHNITVVDDEGRNAWDMCVHVMPSIPNADNVAAQVLALQFNERLMVETANFSAMRMSSMACHPRERLAAVAAA